MKTCNFSLISIAKFVISNRNKSLAILKQCKAAVFIVQSTGPRGPQDAFKGMCSQNYFRSTSKTLFVLTTVVTPQKPGCAKLLVR